MIISEDDIKIINDILVELVTHRRLEDEGRSTLDNGLYSDENKLAEKLGIELTTD